MIYGGYFAAKYVINFTKKRLLSKLKASLEVILYISSRKEM